MTEVLADYQVPSLNLFPLLQQQLPNVTPEQTKVHLASSNGFEDPLDVYLAGEFNEWQQWQKHRNFERPYVLSLIAMPSRDRWLFVGLYESVDKTWYDQDQHWDYQLRRLPQCQAVYGRMIVAFTRPGRQSYLYGETCVQGMTVSQLLPEPYGIVDFPGYKIINLSMAQLRTIVQQSQASWRAALGSVAGIYLITHTPTGKLYVGSAYGEGGIWGRWCQYADTGHGGNVLLREIYKQAEDDQGEHFRFAILEVAAQDASRDVILQREAHWKEVLQSHAPFGLNGN